MSITPVAPIESKSVSPAVTPEKARTIGGAIAWSGLFFILLQSVCTFFAALDGLRILVGAGALASAVEAGRFWDRFHADWIRVPMVVLALAGALLNLAILRRVRRLRSRPSSQWRQQPLSPRKLGMERVQFALSIMTLVLVAVEETMHWTTFHRF